MREIMFNLLFILAFATGCFAGRMVAKPTKDLPSIQALIDEATDGDTILVEPGTYFERINYWGKSVVVKSIAGPDSTVIDGEQNGSVVTFSGCPDTFSVLDGFTVRNGRGTAYQGQRRGGGIYAEVSHEVTSACKLLNCVIENNRADEEKGHGYGGGVYVFYGAFVMRDCTVRKNSAASKGGGVCLYRLSGHVYNNKILNNQATGAHYSENYSGGDGGGMGLNRCDGLLIENNLFKANNAGRPEYKYSYPIAGAILCNEGATIIRNNRFVGNGGAVEGGAMYIGSSSEGTIVAHNIFIENSAGDYWDSGYGGAFCCHGIGGVLVVNNTFIRNGAYQGLYGSPAGGTIDYQKTGSGVFNNIIAETLSGRYAACLLRPSHSNNCYWDNANGDVDDPEENAVFADPMFKNEQYHLQPGSPCIDAGVIKLEDDPYCFDLPDIGARESCTDFFIPFWAGDSLRPYHHNRKE